MGSTLHEYNHHMFPGVGTIINIIAIISGASLGVLVGNRMNARTRTLLTDVLGLVTLLGAASALIPLWSDRYSQALPKGWTLLVVLGSLLIGGLIGSALKLENRLDSLGDTLRVKFKASSDSSFVQGFVTASLLFAIGPLAILGSISDGMGTGIDQLILKSTLDFFAAIGSNPCWLSDGCDDSCRWNNAALYCFETAQYQERGSWKPSTCLSYCSIICFGCSLLIGASKPIL